MDLFTNTKHKRVLSNATMCLSVLVILSFVFAKPPGVRAQPISHSFNNEYTGHESNAGGNSNSNNNHSPTIQGETNQRFYNMIQRLKHPNKNVVIPIFTNLAWVDMSVNVIHQFESFLMPRCYFIYAWDEETCNKFEGMNVDCFFNDTSKSYGKDDQVWGMEGYFDMINSRLEVIQWIHQHTSINTFMLDTDTIFKGNVIDHIDPDAYELQYQEEKPSMSYELDIPTLNGGCWFAKNCPNIKQWLSMSISFMNDLGLPDQDAMNHAIKLMNRTLVHRSFPREDFPNGFDAFILKINEYKTDEERTRNDMVLSSEDTLYGSNENVKHTPVFAHSNWITGYNGKFMRIYDQGGWFLDKVDYSNSDKARYPKAIFKYKSPNPDSSNHSSSPNSYFSFQNQLNRIRKLLHVAIYYGGSISLMNVRCYPNNTMETCGMDTLVDFFSINEHFSVKPETMHRNIPKERHYNLYLDNNSDGGENIEQEREGGNPSVFDPSYFTQDSIVWIHDDENTSYQELQRKFPLDEDSKLTLKNSLSLSGLIWNDARTSIERLSGKPYFCVYDDGYRENKWNLIRYLISETKNTRSNEQRADSVTATTSSSDNTGLNIADLVSSSRTSDYKVYWVNHNVYGRPDTYDLYRMFDLANHWQEEVLSGWGLLWYGMRELDGHVLPSYIQNLVCSQASRIYINALNEENWFVQSVCDREDYQSPCVFF